MVGNEHDPRRRESGYVWAVENLSFDVTEGEVFGIIGHNGAGKSTLLKLLSRITAPTSGRIHANGRIASLLEVGTGFHPELTGRENIFLNGAILGMQRSEIRKRLDEIVDFSGCSRYIDTPVKRYSSGMIVRLGFSVAAHLECETLIVDEVLAVGDVDFQQKCVAKMKEIALSGRTILLVSHNMETMLQLCDRCVILKEGQLSELGKARPVISHYLKQYQDLPASTDLRSVSDRSGSQRATLTKFWIENENQEPLPAIISGHPFQFCIQIETRDGAVDDVSVGVSVHESNGKILTGVTSFETGQCYDLPTGASIVRCRVDKAPFFPGNFLVAARLVSGVEELDWPREFIAGFKVLPGDFYGLGRISSHEHLQFHLSANWLPATALPFPDPPPC